MSSDNEEEEAVIQEREVAAEPDVKAVEEAEEEVDELEEEVEEETEEKESERIEERLDEKQSGGGANAARTRRGKKPKKPSAKKAEGKSKARRRRSQIRFSSFVSGQLEERPWGAEGCVQRRWT